LLEASVGSVRQLDLDDLGAGLLVDFDRLADQAPDLRVEALAEVLPGHADLEVPAITIAEGRRVVGHVAVDAGRVAAVVPGDYFQGQRRVAHVTGQRADLVQARGEGHQAIAAHAAIGGLETDHAAETGGLADRAAGVRAQGQRHHGRGHRGGAAARGAARHVVEAPGIARRVEAAVLGRRAHGELVEVALADDDAVGGANPLDDVSIVWCAEVFEDAAGTGGGQAVGGAHVVFDGHGHAGQGTDAVAGGAALVDPVGLSERLVASRAQEGVDFRIEPLDAGQRRSHQAAAGQVAGPQGGLHLKSGHIEDVGHNEASLPQGRASLPFQAPCTAGGRCAVRVPRQCRGLVSV